MICGTQYDGYVISVLQDAFHSFSPSNFIFPASNQLNAGSHFAPLRTFAIEVFMKRNLHKIFVYCIKKRLILCNSLEISYQKQSDRHSL